MLLVTFLTYIKFDTRKLFVRVNKLFSWLPLAIMTLIVGQDVWVQVLKGNDNDVWND